MICNNTSSAAQQNDAPMPVSLARLPKRTQATIVALVPVAPDDPVALRLHDLGFVAGEEVTVVAASPFGGDPILVQVGFTRFALRLREAARVQVVIESLEENLNPQDPKTPPPVIPAQAGIHSDFGMDTGEDGWQTSGIGHKRENKKQTLGALVTWLFKNNRHRQLAPYPNQTQDQNHG